jgi:putative membrane protein
MKQKKVIFISLAIFGLSISNAFAHEGVSESWFGACNGGMWLFPLIGCGTMFFMFIIAMLFFGRWRMNDPSFRFSCFRPWGYERNAKYSNSSETVLDILKRRYANGEISKEEYEQIKRDVS